MTGPKLLQKAELVDRSQVVYDPTPTLRKFHASNRRVRGVRGPFGCLGGEALVVTDEGLVRIDSLDRSMRVLSYDEKRDRFLFVPASVSYRKGTDALYRVRVQRGEWRAAGHHRVLCDDGVYRRVESLRPGQCVRQCSQDLRRTIGEVCESGFPGSSFMGPAVNWALLSIEREEVESDYWDILVPGTNNYVTADGVVHHNSGKSVGMCWEIFTRAQEQAPSPHDNVRRSRWVVTRNTYGELTSTTMKTWLAWFPEHRFGKVKDGSPITQMCRWGLPDGTKVELEMLFLALDRPDHLAKLLSLEITGAWMNEAREQPQEILDGLDGRIGRYPSAMDGGCTWRGIIMDTNSPDDDHWWYVLAELTEDPTKKFLFLSQPSGDGPDAENLSWLDQTPDTLKHPPGSEVREARGRGYYEALKGGKTKNWIKIYVKGQYGTSEDGKPVYAEEWNDEIHVRPLVPIQGVPLQIGLDFGLTPAAVIGQTDARGRLLLLNEICGNGIAIRQFLEDALVPLLLAEYPQWYAKRQATPAMIRFWGDPAGEQPSQTDARTCFQEVKDQKFRIRAARTNDFVPRRSAVAWFLSKMSGGLPSLLVDPKCKLIRKGFNGSYKYRRIRVTGEARYADEPMKNAYSHPHDALQYLALECGGVQGSMVRQFDLPPPPRLPAPRAMHSSTGLLGN